MSNQKNTIKRSTGFWMGLAFHLALGAALYHYATDQHPVTQKRPDVSGASIQAPAMP